MKDVIGAGIMLILAVFFVIWQASEGDEQAIKIIESIVGDSHEYQRTDP